MSKYLEYMRQARRKQLRLTLAEELEIIKIYENAADNIKKRLRTNKNELSNALLNDITKELNDEITKVRQRLRERIRKDMVEIAYLPLEAQNEWFEDVLKTINYEWKWNFRRAFSQIPTQVVELLVSSKYYSDGLTLSERIWNLSYKNIDDIDKIIKVAISEKATPQELAKYLEEYINPNKILKTKTRIPGINKNIAYQAQRLARTSMAHAFNESTIQSSDAIEPFRKGWKWNLSPNHYERMRKFGKSGDICDEEWASHNEGYGKGVYTNKEDIPIDHPNGLCYITVEVVSIQEAGQRLRRWLKGENDVELDDWYKKWENEIINS